MTAEEAIDQAVFVALDGAVAATVHQHVPAPNAADYPHVVLGDIDNVEPICPGDPDIRGDLSIIVMTEGEERQSCSALAGQVRSILDNKILSAGGFSIRLAARSSTIALDEGAKGYNGIVTFGVIALTE